MNSPKIAVVFHSVCANTFLMARQLRDSLAELGAEVLLFRLPDPNYTATADAFPASREFKSELLRVRELASPAPILGCDALFLGSPTYFGNVSASAKAFIDSFVDYWAEGRFAGMFFGGFASAGTPQGGGDLCLQALCHFAMHMGMCLLPVPSTVGGGSQPAYGLCHWSGDNADRRLTDAEKEAVRDYCAYVYPIIARRGGNEK